MGVTYLFKVVLAKEVVIAAPTSANVGAGVTRAKPWCRWGWGVREQVDVACRWRGSGGAASTSGPGTRYGCA